MWRGEGDMVLGKVCVSARWGSATDGGWVTGRQLSTTYASAYSSVGFSWDPFRQPYIRWYMFRQSPERRFGTRIELLE